MITRSKVIITQVELYETIWKYGGLRRLHSNEVIEIQFQTKEDLSKFENEVGNRFGKVEQLNPLVLRIVLNN